MPLPSPTYARVEAFSYTAEVSDQSTGAYEAALSGPHQRDLRFGFKLAYLRSFSVPSVARSVAAHGRLDHDPRARARRTADTVLAIVQSGDPAKRRAAAAALRTAHVGVDGHVDDFRYVLACLLVTPIEFVAAANRVGLTRTEVEGAVRAYRDVGAALDLGGFPTSYAEAADHLHEHERQHGCRTTDGARMVNATIEAYAGRARPRRYLVRWLIRGGFRNAQLTANLGLGRSSRASTSLALMAYRVLRRGKREAF